MGQPLFYDLEKHPDDMRAIGLLRPEAPKPPLRRRRASELLEDTGSPYARRSELRIVR